MISTNKEMKRLIHERQKHKGEYNQAQKCTCNTSEDVGQRRQLRKELQERYGLLEIEAVNILGGVHGAFYVAKYDRIRNGIPLEHSPTKNTLDKED